MTNVHLKEAASNIRRAVNDLHLLQQETQAQTNDQIRQKQQRIKDIDYEKGQLRVNLAQTQDAAKLEGELKQLQKDITDLQANTQRQVQDLDKQAIDFESLAGRLEMMA